MSSGVSRFWSLVMVIFSLFLASSSANFSASLIIFSMSSGVSRFWSLVMVIFSLLPVPLSSADTEFREENLYKYRIKPLVPNHHSQLLKTLRFTVSHLVVEVEKESSLLLVLSLLSGEGTSGSVVSGLGERADGLVELQGFHEVKSSIDGGDGVVLSNLHPGHDGPVVDGSSGEGWDGMGRGEDAVLSILEKPVSES